MNQIIRNYLNEHVVEYNIGNYKEEKAFEHFINKCIVSRYSSERFDPDDVMTHDGEIGLDGIAILANNVLITSIEQCEEIYSKDKNVRTDFVFIQTKTSDNFSLDEMSVFIRGVQNFFTDKENHIKTNDKEDSLVDIKDYIYSQMTTQEFKPFLSLYYVACGTWSENTNLAKILENDKRVLLGKAIFENVNYYPFDQNDIINLNKEMRRKISKTFTMVKHIAFFEMPGVKEAHLGLIKCKDLVLLLKDKIGKLFPNIFEDNVRDFQGYNPVNSEIRNTLKNKETQHCFAVLNNGITILAKKISFSGDEITIFDYQIVNGCQTSRVLFDNESLLNENSYVVAKLIQVENEELLDSIVFTSNRQTEVKYEAFASSKAFHKKLEEYYNSVESDYRLYYERRSKQFDMEVAIPKYKIVTLAMQTYSYIAMFLQEPQSVHRYYGELLMAYKGRLYGDDDCMESYYIASYYFYCIDSEIKKRNLKKIVKYKFHLCMIMCGLIAEIDLCKGNSKRMKGKAKALIQVSRNAKEFSAKLETSITILETSITILEDCLKEYESSEEALKSIKPYLSKKFTAILIEHIQKYTNKILDRNYLKKGDVVSCIVTAIAKHFVYVDLRENDSRNIGSIHISEIDNRYIYNINDYFRIGDNVQARIISDEYTEQYGWSLSTKGLWYRNRNN